MSDGIVSRADVLIDAMGDGVYALDLDGRFTSVNDRFVELAGYAREDLLGAGPPLLIEAADVERFEGVIADLVSADDLDVATVETTLERADGTTIPVEVALSTISEDGEPSGTMGVVRDISRREARERELEHYRRLVEAADDSIYTLDLDGRYTSVNDRFLEWTGYDRETLLGEHASLLVRPEDAASMREAVTETIRQGDSFVGDFEYPVRRADDEWRWVHGRLSVLRYDGEVQGTVGIVRDIHDQREHERQLRRQNERLDRFASVLSHDLRSPINVAQGRVDLAAGECDSEHLGPVRSALDRMDGLVTRLHTLAQQGQPVDEPEPVPLEAAARRAWKHVETGDATLVVADAGSVTADPERLGQVFENLFANAMTHGLGTATDTATGAGGPGGRPASDGGADTRDLTVRVGRLADGFVVEDDGVGIDPSVEDELFEWNVTTAAEDGVRPRHRADHRRRARVDRRGDDRTRRRRTVRVHHDRRLRQRKQRCAVPS